LVYLNEPIRGGTTDFPNLGISVIPKIGRILIFHNVFEGTNNLHPNSLHAGMPVIEGEKYAFNLWFRQQNIKHPFTYDITPALFTEREVSSTHGTESDIQVHSSMPFIATYHDIFKETDLESIQAWVETKSPSQQMEGKRIWWIPHSQVPGISKTIHEKCDLPIHCMENICAYEYSPGFEDVLHHDAFAEGSRGVVPQGQRIASIIGFIGNSPTLHFNTSPSIEVEGSRGSCIVHWNTCSPRSETRIAESQSFFSRVFSEKTYVFYIFIRQRSLEGRTFCGTCPMLSTSNSN
jgi:predicted nucleic acid binding AN1-type Zn finger protein